MGLINKFLKRCVLCKNKDGILTYIHAYGIYEEKRAGHWFHRSCLADVVCYPKNYTIRTVDMAIDIGDRIRLNMKNNHEKEKERQIATDKLCNDLT